MKYAITGPEGRINRVLDKANDRTVEITDDQAETVNSSKEPIFLIESELKTLTEFQAIKRTEREATRIAAMTPEQLAAKQQREATQAAYTTAAAAFETLPLGKQALWEPVRAKVAEAIRSGNIATAVEILQTTPVIYDGAEADRDMFLSLFQ